jgi:hypothetical protein
MTIETDAARLVRYCRDNAAYLGGTGQSDEAITRLGARRVRLVGGSLDDQFVAELGASLSLHADSNEDAEP